MSHWFTYRWCGECLSYAQQLPPSNIPNTYRINILLLGELLEHNRDASEEHLLSVSWLHLTIYGVNQSLSYFFCLLFLLVHDSIFCIRRPAKSSFKMTLPATNIVYSMPAYYTVPVISSSIWLSLTLFSVFIRFFVVHIHLQNYNFRTITLPWSVEWTIRSLFEWYEYWSASASSKRVLFGRFYRKFALF